jgi:hypothetical protein
MTSLVSSRSVKKKKRFCPVYDSCTSKAVQRAKKGGEFRVLAWSLHSCADGITFTSFGTKQFNM